MRQIVMTKAGGVEVLKIQKVDEPQPSIGEVKIHVKVIGINFAPGFIHPVNATVERVVDHIDHIVNLVGVEHVGLGSDFDGIRTTPKGLEDVSKLPNITRVLVQRRYSEEEIKKILGGNHLRVFKKVLR